MDLGGQRRDGEAPFEAQPQVAHDADDDEGHGDDAVATQLFTDLRANEGAALLDHVRTGDLECGDDIACHLGGGFITGQRDRVLVVLGLHADGEVTRTTNGLDQRVLEAGFLQCRANVRRIDGGLVFHFDRYAADEVLAVVEALGKDQADRANHQQDGKANAETAQAEEVEVRIVVEDFHGFLLRPTGS